MSDQRRSKVKGATWLISAIALATAAALGFSRIVRLVPFSFEEKVADAVPIFSGGTACSTSPDLDKLIARLYPLELGDERQALKIRLVRADEVNAFASLGGQIFINEGLLKQAESPEELAGVLAHEIEHVKRRHVLEGVLVKLGTVGAIQLFFSDFSGSELVQTILGLQYGKAQEREADEGGLRRLVRAEIDTAGFRKFFERMRKSSSSLSFISDHPSDSFRADRARAFEGRPHREILNLDEWARLKSACR